MQALLNTLGLSPEQNLFLSTLPVAEDADPGIPVFVKQSDGTFRFIPEFKLATKANKQFEKEAPAGLYRGGAVILVKYQDGTLVVPDDRYHWFKPFAGIAHHDEGADLVTTGIRELVEKAFVFDLKKTTRFVPRGTSLESNKASSLNFTVDQIIEVGEVRQIGMAVNEQNRAYEAVLEWNINEIGVPFSVTLDEDWWSGGHSGVSVFVMNAAGDIRGLFSGQQGFQSIPDFGIHPTLSQRLA